MDQLVIGVDVGTGSARAGVFDRAGRCLGRAERKILLHRPQPDHAEHSSEDIWQAVCASVREAVGAAGADPAAIVGIGFDATCSLVVRDRDGRAALGLDHRRARTGTPSSGSTIAPSPRPRNAPPAATGCSTMSAA